MNRAILTITCLFVMAGNLHSITSKQKEQARKLVAEYYEALESLSNQPSPSVEQKLLNLFEDGGFVFNDLYSLESERGNGLINENQLAEVSQYIGTIRNLWSHNVKLNIQSKIEPSSYIELSEPNFDGTDEKVLYVTVTKYISYSGDMPNNNNGIQETFKIKSGKIQSVRLPEDATNEIHIRQLLSRKDYNEAYRAFLKSISNPKFNSAEHFWNDQSIIYWMSDVLNMGKIKGIPKEVQKWLSFYYEAKYCKHPFVFRKYKKSEPRWKKSDFEYLMCDSASSTPFVHGLMPVFEGRRGSLNYVGYEGVDYVGEAYGYMNENGDMVIPFYFRWAEPFSKEYRVARVGVGTFYSPRCELINLEGKTLTSKWYSHIWPFYNGLAVVEDMDLQYGLINTDGEEIVPCSYRYIESFYGKRQLTVVTVETNDKILKGCIDINGHLVIPAEYHNIVVNADKGIITLQKTRNSEKITMPIPNSHL